MNFDFKITMCWFLYGTKMLNSIILDECSQAYIQDDLEIKRDVSVVWIKGRINNSQFPTSALTS